MSDVTAQYIAEDRFPTVSYNTASILKHRCKYATGTTRVSLLVPKNTRVIIYSLIGGGNITIKSANAADGTGDATTLYTFTLPAAGTTLDLSSALSNAPLVCFSPEKYHANNKYLVIESTTSTIVGYTVYQG